MLIWFIKHSKRCYDVCAPNEYVENNLFAVKPYLKDTSNIGHNTFDLSIKDKSYGVPIGPWHGNFTSEREQHFCNSKMRPKIVDPQVSVI